MTDVPSRLAAALSDRYRIERELGQGGMATVYLAEDLRHGREVAIKVLRPELAATLGPERFTQEIEIAARLQHPHILPVHDSGEAAGFLFYVMPYVEGESLRERLVKRGELPVHEAVRLLIEVADALAYAHGRNVVHRDIKPENIMVSGRHALVMDFGVAKAVSEATGRNRLTTAGVALGTPAYMAPEQASADPNLDQRVDVYALGVLGYELLSGRPPFTGGTPQQILAAHVTTAPEPLTGRRPTVSAALGAVIMRALEKRPADRWQTAEEMLAQLEPLATPSGGTTPAQTQPARAIATRTGRGLGIAVGAGAIVVAVAGVLLWQGRAAAPSAPVTLDRVQLTTSGHALNAVVSPDGKEVVYTERPCAADAERCLDRLVVHDVATGARQVIIDNVESAAPYQWSPSGGWIMAWIRAVGADGSTLSIISHLGGAAVSLGGGNGAFTPHGDTALVAPDLGGTGGGTVWLRAYVAPWTQAVDSARLPTPEGVLQLDDITIAPNGQWIAARWDVVGQQEAVLSIVDRHGRQVASRRVEQGPPLGEWNAASTALLRPVWAGGQGALERIRINARTGALGATDTIRLSPNDWRPGFGRSADGTLVAYTEAHSGEHAIWTLTASSAAQVPRKARLVMAGAALHDATITPDGSAVLYLAGATAGHERREQFFAVPFAGGAARAVTPLLAGLMAAAPTSNSRRLVVATRGASPGSQITAYDIATGRVIASVQRADTSYNMSAAGSGGVALVTYHLVTILDDALREVRRVPVPDSIGNAVFGIPAPDGTSIALFVEPRDLRTLLTANGDYATFLYLIGPSGSLTRATSWNFHGRWFHAAVRWESDGSLRFVGGTNADLNAAIYRVPFGGAPQQRLAPVPFHGNANLDFSVDGRRGVVTVYPTTSDVWLLKNFAPAIR